MVTFMRDAVVDRIRPFRDSDMEVERVWYPCAEGAPALGFPTAFTSARQEPYPWLERTVGEVYPPVIRYRKTPTPAGLTYDHVCGTPEEFAHGLTLDPDLPPVMYGPDWIPLCCRPTLCCEFVICGTEPEYGLPASQWHQLREATPDAPPDSQRVISDVGWWDVTPLNPWPAYNRRFLPKGEAGNVPFIEQLIATPDGTGYQVHWKFKFSGGTEHQVTHNDAGINWAISEALGDCFLRLTMLAGQGYLRGTNVRIHDELLPDYQRPPSYAEVTPGV